MPPVRILVPTDSSDPTSWEQAVVAALAAAEAAQLPTRDFVLLIPSQHQLRGTSLEAHVGEAQAKELLAGRSITLVTGVKLSHVTLRTLRSSQNGVILAFYADDAMLEKLDGLKNVAGVVAVPEFPGEADKWKSRWNPVIFGQEQGDGAAEPLIKDPVVEKAMIYLSDSINLANGALNPRDKDHANETLRILRNKGHLLEPDDIKSWAIRNGWQLPAANDLSKLAGRVAGLKTKPPLGSFHNPEGKYQRWTNA